MSAYTFTADRGDSGRRLDLVLCRHLAVVAGASRTCVQRWIGAGRVAIDGTPVVRAATRVLAGSVLGVSLPDRSRRLMRPEALPLDVVHEDEHLLVVNKPPGIVAHPTYAHFSGTLMNRILWHARQWPAPLRPTLVGRLDKQTSGLVIVAKSRLVHAALQRAWTSAGSEKDYLAVVHGWLNASHGTIALPLGRDRTDRRRVVVDTGGKPSETRWERLAVATVGGARLSLLRCRLVTGRMHQIRVHLAAQGRPIVGDFKYGAPRLPCVGDLAVAVALKAFSRHALHAWRVAFTHPVTRQRVELEAPVPVDMERLMTAVGAS
jgi:23S rRNA pseudouridine1911/1915/1917 synthase